MNTTDLVKARLDANRIRGEYLMLLSAGAITPTEVIEEANLPGKEALLSLSLRRMLVTQRGLGDGTVRTILNELISVTEATQPAKRLTIGWLVDPKTGGRRLIALANILHPHGAPWPGFPFTRKPGGHHSNG